MLSSEENSWMLKFEKSKIKNCCMFNTPNNFFFSFRRYALRQLSQCFLALSLEFKSFTDEMVDKSITSAGVSTHNGYSYPLTMHGLCAQLIFQVCLGYFFIRDNQDSLFDVSY